MSRLRPEDVGLSSPATDDQDATLSRISQLSMLSGDSGSGEFRETHLEMQDEVKAIDEEILKVLDDELRHIKVEVEGLQGDFMSKETELSALRMRQQATRNISQTIQRELLHFEAQREVPPCFESTVHSVDDFLSP